MLSPLRPALLLLASVSAPAFAQRLDYAPVEDDRLAAPAQLAYQAVDVPDAVPDHAGAGAKRKWLQWGLLDRFEHSAQRGEDGFAWDFSALLGGTRNRLWVGSTGEGPAWDTPDYHELHLLYSRNLGGPVDLNAGARWDAQSGPDRYYGALGAQYDDGEALWVGGWAYLSN